MSWLLDAASISSEEKVIGKNFGYEDIQKQAYQLATEKGLFRIQCEREPSAVEQDTWDKNPRKTICNVTDFKDAIGMQKILGMPNPGDYHKHTGWGTPLEVRKERFLMEINKDFEVNKHLKKFVDFLIEQEECPIRTFFAVHFAGYGLLDVLCELGFKPHKEIMRKLRNLEAKFI